MKCHLCGEETKVKNKDVWKCQNPDCVIFQQNIGLTEREYDENRDDFRDYYAKIRIKKKDF